MLLESKDIVFVFEGNSPFLKGRAFKYSSLIVNLRASRITFMTKSGIVVCNTDNTFVNYGVKNEFSNDKTVIGTNPYVDRIFKPFVFDICKN